MHRRCPFRLMLHRRLVGGKRLRTHGEPIHQIRRVLQLEKKMLRSLNGHRNKLAVHTDIVRSKGQVFCRQHFHVHFDILARLCDLEFQRTGQVFAVEHNRHISRTTRIGQGITAGCGCNGLPRFPDYAYRDTLQTFANVIERILIGVMVHHADKARAGSGPRQSDMVPGSSP